MHRTTVALFDCLNPDCWCPGGQAELPDCLDTTDVSGAQTDWPICDACLEPLSLVCPVEPNDELLRGLAEEAFDQAEVAALLRLKMICEELIAEKGYAGDGGITSTQAQGPAPSHPRREDDTPTNRTVRALSNFGAAGFVAVCSVSVALDMLCVMLKLTN